MTNSSTSRPPRAVAFATLPAPTEPAAFVEHVLRLTDHREEIAAISAAALAGQPSPTVRVKRRAEIDAMRTWQTAARARLADLRGGHLAIEPARAADLARRLTTRMSKSHLRVAMLEGAERRWHVAVKEARAGIALRDGIRPDPRLHLELARATFMLEGNSPRLRADLAAAAASAPASKGLAYWRARYEVMVGHGAAAADAVKDARDYPPIRNVVMPLLEPDDTQAPWLSWPSNFYTYRYALATDDALHGMQEALAGLANDPQLVASWTALGIPAAAITLLQQRAAGAAKALEALLLWNQANRDMTHEEYASAVANYEACQRAIIAYFSGRFHLTIPEPRDESGGNPAPGQQLDTALDQLATAVLRYNGPARHVWTFFRERYMALTLDELYEHDWRRPNVVPLAYEFSTPLPDYGDATDFGTALARLLTQMSILKSLQIQGDKVEEKIDAPLVAIALVFCPLAIAEANRLRRNFDDALSPLKALLRRHAQFKILSEVVEKPFAKILKAQILLDKADAQYKARALAVAPATNPDGSLRYQGLEAAETYQGVLAAFEDQGSYVQRVNSSVSAVSSQVSGLLAHTFHPIAANAGASQPALSPAERRTFALVGKTVAIETMVTRQGEYPNPDRRIRPHESLLGFAPGTPAGESNPAIYALVLQARGRLLQMEAGLNYLGYSDDYIPPWRFVYLLDRARYFAEHAKNAQREYLNFLTNAEAEGLKELTAAQNVELEKANIRVESARVDQVRAEVESAKASSELAQLTASDADARFARYRAFDAEADRISGTGMLGLLVGNTLSMLPDPFADAAAGVIDFFTGGAASKAIDRRIASLQRDYEKYNLQLAAGEAHQAEVVADRQLDVAQQGLVVAGMQRAAAVLRHEQALQNLAFLRNRTLSSELWYRLAGALRGVADTYLRYAIEMAFLAEQAYEFEADKRMDVIRFDYDVSDLGAMLAADFLLRDLDTLEQDLIVSQTSRQQQVRYVMSMASEMPEALQELRASGNATFTLRLEQIERRFPGLFNARIASVDVLPLAVMDSSRFNLELTHLGSGQLRLKAEPGAVVEPASADWLTGLGDAWAVRPRVLGPETAVYSGLSRQEAAQGSFGANQRGAFEGRPGASAWRIDMGLRENRVVPDTLADMVVTFTLAGYHDATLRDAVERAPRTAAATTVWLSGQSVFPDAYYELHRSGRMDWETRPETLALQGELADAVNVAVVAVPSQRRVELGRLACAYAVELDVDAAGQVRVAQALPRFALATAASRCRSRATSRRARRSRSTAATTAA